MYGISKRRNLQDFSQGFHRRRPVMTRLICGRKAIGVLTASRSRAFRSNRRTEGAIIQMCLHARTLLETPPCPLLPHLRCAHPLTGADIKSVTEPSGCSPTSPSERLATPARTPSDAHHEQPFSLHQARPHARQLPLRHQNAVFDAGRAEDNTRRPATKVPRRALAAERTL